MYTKMSGLKHPIVYECKICNTNSYMYKCKRLLVPRHWKSNRNSNASGHMRKSRQRIWILIRIQTLIVKDPEEQIRQNSGQRSAEQRSILRNDNDWSNAQLKRNTSSQRRIALDRMILEETFFQRKTMWRWWRNGAVHPAEGARYPGSTCNWPNDLQPPGINQVMLINQKFYSIID